MSFQTKITHKKPYKFTNRNSRKEKDSLTVNGYKSFFHTQSERASAFTSRGSLTLEAALVVPIFFLAILCITYLFEMMAIQTAMRNALYSAGRQLAQNAYVSPIVSAKELEQQIIEDIGRERLGRSLIVGGAAGIDCGKSTSNWGTAEFDLSVCYDLEIPILMFRIPVISREETIKIKGWNGYAEGFSFPDAETKVYITDYGLVYHKDMACTYLELSVREVKAEEVEDLRNQSGGKYYACSFCKHTPALGGKLYITDYGNRYHNSLECSRIKRNVYAVPLDEVFGLGGCSKCVK